MDGFSYLTHNNFLLLPIPPALLTTHIQILQQHRQSRILFYTADNQKTRSACTKFKAGLGLFHKQALNVTMVMHKKKYL